MRRTKLVVTFLTGLCIAFCCNELRSQESAFCTSTVLGEIFCDDFSDGSVTDSDPVRWGTVLGGRLGVEDDSLVITNSVPGFPAAQAIPVAMYTDISVRAQVRLLVGDSIGFAVRRSPRVNKVYGGFIQNDQALIGVGGSGQVLARGPVDLDVKNEDVLLQFDVFGDSLKLWAWPVGEKMPTEPVVSAVNDEIEEGSFYVWAATIGRGDSDPIGAFRFIQAATQSISDRLPGDFNGDGILDAADITLLSDEVQADSQNLEFDVNGDANLDQDDRVFWVHELRKAWFGDANLDDEFNTSDFVLVLASGTYEADIDSDWSIGDFDGNGRTNSGDLVVALADGGYEQGPRAAASGVPEPSGGLLILFGMLGVFRRRR